MAFSFSFGAICFAVDEIKTGVTPSVTGSFGAIGHRLDPFLRLLLLLFFMILAAAGVGGWLLDGVLRILRQGHVHTGRFAIFVLTYGLSCLALLVMSRFGLAMPALLLDDYPVAQAMFRSDELTEGKWLTLAALLAKSLIRRLRLRYGSLLVGIVHSTRCSITFMVPLNFDDCFYRRSHRGRARHVHRFCILV